MLPDLACIRVSLTMMPSDCHIAWVRSQSDATAEDSTADPHSALSEHTTDWSDGMSEEVHTTQTSQTRQKCENGQCVSERDVLHHGNDMMQSASCGSCVGHLSETTHRQREETAHRDREETARREREETARREREETARREREETARREREETAHREREETAHREREETAHREREETAHREREEPCPELCVVRHTLSPEGADSWEIDTINSPPSCSLITSAVAENGMSSFHCSSDKVENGMSSFDCSSDKVENGMSSFHCSSEEAENGMSSFHCSSDEADGDDGKYLSYRRDIKGQVLVDDAGTPDRQDVKGQVLVDDAGTSDRQDEETVSRDSCPSSGCEHLDEAGHVSVLQSSSYVQMFHSQNNFSQRRSDSLSQGSGECSSVVASNGELSSCAWTSPQQCVSEPSVVIQLGQDEGGCGQHTKPERTLLDLSSSVNSDLSPGDPIDSSSQLAGHGNLTEKSAAVKHRFAGDQGHAQTGVVEHAAASDHGNSETRGPGEHSGSRPFAFSRSEQVPCSGSIKQHSGVDTSASEPVDQALSHLPEDLQTKRDMCSVDSSNNGLSLTLANLSQAVSPSSGDSQAAMNTVSLQHSQGDPLLGSSVDGDALCAPAAQQDNQSCDSGLERNQSSNTPVVSVSLSQVPDEVLLQVFSFFLPVELCRHVTLVCKCWHRLAYDDSLWRKLDLSCLRVSGFQLCQIILRVSGAVRYLDISGMMHLTNAEMAIVAEHCPQLAHLDVGFVDDWNATMMHSVLTCCPNLQFLNMEGCRHANNEMMREVTASAGSGLRRLNFSHCSMVDESFMLMMHHLPGLTHLNIDGISWISEM